MLFSLYDLIQLAQDKNEVDGIEDFGNALQKYSSQKNTRRK